MPRVAIFFIVLFVSLFVVLASPIPTPDGTTAVDLEKRTVHSGGRVRALFEDCRSIIYSHKPSH